MSHALQPELDLARRLAREAGSLILEVYATDFEVEQKGGHQGPVTEADKRANAHIVAGLRAAFPNDAIVAEESKNRPDYGRYERAWFVDPLDGTREFVKKNGEFAVQIGLAVRGTPAVGVVYRPVGDRLWSGIVGQGAHIEEQGRSRALQLEAPGDRVRLVVSRSNRSAHLEKLKELTGADEILESGSVGLKCGLLALGEADLYLHASPYSSRWDACGPEAMLRAAGGVLLDVKGNPYRYDDGELENERGLLACHPALLPRAREAVERLLKEIPPGKGPRV